jgi:hypothetical protein
VGLAWLRLRFPEGVELGFTASTTLKIDDVTLHSSMTERTDVGGVIVRRERRHTVDEIV